MWDAIAEESESGLQALIGYRIAEWREGFAAIELDLADKHMNRSGVLHGGVVATLLDSVCGLAGCYCPVPGRMRRAVSLSLSLNFVGQARERTIRAEGRKVGGGRKIFFCRGELGVPAQGVLLATADGAFRYRTGSEDPAGVPRDREVG